MIQTEMSPTVQSRWLDIDGLRIHCFTAGERGPAVLLLHGGGIDSAVLSYKHTIPALARTHRVFAPDLPGYGLSDKPNVTYSIDYYVAFIERLMDALDLNTASMVGLSLGGGIGLALALDAPQRVEKLVLVDSYGLGKEIPWGPLGALLVRLPLLNTLSWAAIRRSRRLMRQTMYTYVGNRHTMSEALVDEAFEVLQQPGSGRAFQSFQRHEALWNGLRTDFSSRLTEVQAPTLIVHGELDRAVPVAWAHRAQQRIPNARLHIVPQCGHWPPREQPEAFNQVVGQFLAGADLE